MALTLDNSQDWQFDDALVDVVLERETTAKDSSGGPTATPWVPVATCKGDLQPASGQVRRRFMQLGLVVPYTIYLSADVGARASDRIRVNGRNFQLVEGGYETGWDMTGFPATAHVQEVPSSP